MEWRGTRIIPILSAAFGASNIATVVINPKSNM
jgi:hypothetical protein